jgi:hypothetical protein
VRISTAGVEITPLGMDWMRYFAMEPKTERIEWLLDEFQFLEKIL